MKVALLGATGFVGSALLNEALSRGHTVTAIGQEGIRRVLWVGGAGGLVEDFAVAMIGGLEKPHHQHQRFTVGY